MYLFIHVALYIYNIFPSISYNTYLPFFISLQVAIELIFVLSFFIFLYSVFSFYLSFPGPGPIFFARSFCLFVLALSSRLVSHTSVSFRSLSLCFCLFIYLYLNLFLLSVYHSVFRVFFPHFFVSPSYLSAGPLSLHCYLTHGRALVTTDETCRPATSRARARTAFLIDRFIDCLQI